MKNIVFARVDDRLIHGEVVTAWVPTYRINHIIVVDDEIAGNSFQKRILKSLSPTNVRVDSMTVSDAAQYLQGEKNDKERILLLTKSPIAYQQLVEKEVELPQVNLGGMGIRGERKPFVKNVACNPAEVEAIKALIAAEIHVFYQLVPEQRVIEVKDLV
ncbi:PTS system mannose/fructose/N-acetylgalactosamine-transporter subunit IIB [Xylocopilactobacillus apicola]|uniref:PTS mannose transporter subunit IID n=1 Tax=Xylocopilactobacillus apicola TaxID=2932184 RepID=A0AAU9DRC2_9LACO|nr:PTS sugar transporter subunit IIB [Xylocopilactobacillus apicola]BDR57713.1 PTS mannose transporter subunit IID [Xylocopilactobacillus apicola]